MDRLGHRRLTSASIWAALGWLYGCDNFEDTASEPDRSPATASLNSSPQTETILGKIALPAGAAARMVEEGRHGVVIVIPADPHLRSKLGAILEGAMKATETWFAGLSRMGHGNDTLWVATLSEFVVSCVPADKATGAAGGTTVLIAPDGASLASAKLRLTDAASLVEDVRSLCEAEPHASARAAAVDPDALKRLERRLAHPELFRADLSDDDRSEALDRWSDLVRECLPALADRLRYPIDEGAVSRPMFFERHKEELEVHSRLTIGLQRAPLAGLVENERGEPVVHGVRWTYEHYDACPLCGIGYFPAQKRNFDAFLDG